MTRTARIFGACSLLAALGCCPLGAAAAPAATLDGASLRRADFKGEAPAPDVQHIADWAVHSGDNQGLPFIVVDKASARALAFDRVGRLVESTPVLLGIAVGDKFAPGVINMDMYQTQPWQRITPAGRFFAEEDRNLKGERVLWVDYDAGIAIHKIPAKRTKQRRHERMVSPDPAQHRITYGCINVPPAFYDRVVHRHFGPKGGIVYVLPDSTPLKAVFKSYDVDAGDPARASQATGPFRPHPMLLALP
jgi:hypothetical protein